MVWSFLSSSTKLKLKGENCSGITAKSGSLGCAQRMLQVKTNFICHWKEQKSKMLQEDASSPCMSVENTTKKAGWTQRSSQIGLKYLDQKFLAQNRKVAFIADNCPAD